MRIALFKTNGKIVEVDGHHMNVYLSGNPNSDFTLVFMSGAGTCSPTLDFKTLYSLFEKDYQIAVVEKAGYGFSDISDISRDIDTILFETRESLNQAGVTNHKIHFYFHILCQVLKHYIGQTNIQMKSKELLDWIHLYLLHIKTQKIKYVLC